tara:strand:- start:440 stop:595 length:156 start_codon:yes stop_codon:yes gene_type:complete
VQDGEKAPAHGAVGRCPAVLRTLIPGFGGLQQSLALRPFMASAADGKFSNR